MAFVLTVPKTRAKILGLQNTIDVTDCGLQIFWILSADSFVTRLQGAVHYHEMPLKVHQPDRCSEYSMNSEGIDARITSTGVIILPMTSIAA